jgi:hypothetical protein
MSDSDLRVALLAAKTAASSSLDCAAQLLLFCHTQDRQEPLLAWFQVLRERIALSERAVPVVREFLHRYPADGEACIGAAVRLSAMAAAAEYARSMYETILTALLEREEEETGWGDLMLHADSPSSLNDVIGTAVRAHHPSSDREQVVQILCVGIDREFARVSAGWGVEPVLPGSDDTRQPEEITIRELAEAIFIDPDTVRKKCRSTGGPAPKIEQSGRSPAKYDFCELVTWAARTWPNKPLPNNRQELSEQIRQASRN